MRISNCFFVEFITANEYYSKVPKIYDIRVCIFVFYSFNTNSHFFLGYFT